MIDLHAGVIEIFAEAQHLGRPRKLRSRVLSFEEQRRLRRAFRPLHKMKIKDQWRQRIDRELRANRKAYVIVPVVWDEPVHQGETRTRECGHCGHTEELRPGLARWQHMTPYGACAR